MEELKFTPVGAYDLWRHLGAEVPFFNRWRHRYTTADLAFLAAGASEDGQHQVPANEFFPEYWHLLESQPAGPPGQLARKEFGDKCRRIMFDLVRPCHLPHLFDSFLMYVCLGH
jgi:hypothetical protein